MIQTLCLTACLCLPFQDPAGVEVQDLGRRPVEPTRTLEVYDVTELIERTAGVWTSEDAPAVTRLSDEDGFRSADEDLSNLARQLDLQRDRKAALRSNLQEFARLVRVFGEPRFGEGDKVEAVGDGSLLVSAAPEQHAFVRRFLELQQGATGYVRISTRIVTGPKDSFAKLGISARAVFATADELQRVLDQLQAGEFEQVVAPHLLSNRLQRSEISALSDFAYVKEFRTQVVQPSGDLIVDPVIDTIHEGVTCRVRTIELEGGALGLTLDVENVEVRRPVETKKVRIAAGTTDEGEISLPAVDRVRISGDLRLADGASAALVAPMTDTRDMALFVTVTRQAPDKAPARR